MRAGKGLAGAFYLCHRRALVLSFWHQGTPACFIDLSMSNSSTSSSGLHQQHGLYPAAQTVDDFRHNLAIVQERIDASCARAGRNSSEIRLLPVSKTVPPERIRLAYEAGCRWLGENKAQEGDRKAKVLADLPDLKWSMIGHLQTNKARYVARFASEFQALDRIEVAEALQHRLQLEERELDVFVQVNTSGEVSKYGLEPDTAEAFIQQLGQFSRLRVKGLMTLALFSSNPDEVRPCFRLLRALRDRLRSQVPAGVQLDELSMGMSGDFEIAIEEGATVIRVGQAIFGARSTADSAYWPKTGA